MPGLGSLLAWAGLIAWAGWLAALASGRSRLNPGRDETDALQARWLLGGMSVAGAAFLLVAVDDLGIRLLAVPVLVAGLAVVVTARRRAPTDETTLLAAVEIQRRVREFAFESRPIARGPVEAFPRLGYTLFVAGAGLGAAVLAVLAGIDMADNPHLEPWQRVAAAVGLGGLLIVLVVVPAMWWVLRAVRWVPFLRIDDWGVVLGRDRLRDLSIEWGEIAVLEVRSSRDNLVRDLVVLLHPADADAWEARQTLASRTASVVFGAMYNGRFAIPTRQLDVPFDEILARIALHKPSLIDR